jgi:hypothetical protein
MTNRQIIILRYFEEATQDEVADLYGLSQQAVSLREGKAYGSCGYGSVTFCDLWDDEKSSYR